MANKKTMPASDATGPNPFLMLTDPALHHERVAKSIVEPASRGRIYKAIEASGLYRPKRLFDVFVANPQTGELTPYVPSESAAA